MEYFSSKNFKAVLADTNANKEADMAHYQRDKYNKSGSPRALNKAQKHELTRDVYKEYDKNEKEKTKRKQTEQEYMDADEAVIQGNVE